VLLAGGSGGDAAEVALRAAETAAAAPVEAARARVLAGRALARAGERASAIAELQRAERDLAACGAARYRDEAAAELRRLGRRARRNRAYATGLSALTPRERQIAELVSAGKTNREIAAICFISAKTVEATLSSTYAKLGVSNRAGLSRVIATRRPAE
jgi:DNA-binding CsgD family transcriptional regulator